MAAVKEVELIVPQGTTFFYEVTFVDPAANNAPIDLTGFTARMMARDKVADADPPKYATTSNGGHLSINAAAGKVRLEVPASVTATWNFKRWVFDLEVESPAGKVYRLVKGSMTLDLEVTR